MDSAIVSALGTGLSVTTFLVGFSSVRLRAQRDRALSRTDAIAADLTRAGVAERPVDDAEVEAAALAFSEADKPDPVGRWTVIVAWTVALMMCALLALYRADAPPSWVLSPSSWGTGTFVALFLLGLEVIVAGLGTFDYRWVADDLEERLSESILGLASSAIESSREDDDTKALASVQRLEERAPTWPWVHVFKAHVLGKLERRPEALLALERAIALDPDNPWWRVARAEVYLAQKEHARALDDLETLGPKLPDQGHVYRIYGAALYALNRRPEAIAAFDHALALEPNSTVTRMERGQALIDSNGGLRSSPSRMLIEMLVDEGAKVAFDTLSEVGINRLRSSEALAAIDDFSFVIVNDPNNYEAYAWRAAARAEVGQVDLVDADVKMAIDGGVEPGRVYRRVGAGFGVGGRFTQAEEAFTSALKEDLKEDQRALVHFLRAITRQRFDENTDFIADFDEAVRLDPDELDFRAHRAAALLGVGRFEDAHEDIAFVEEHGASVDHYYVWVEELMNAGKDAEAADIVERGIAALADDPEAAGLFALRGSVRVSLRMYRGALDDFGRADESEILRPEVSYRRALCLQAMGDADAALEAIALAAETTWTLQFAAIASRATMLGVRGDAAGAMADFDRAIEMRPDSPSLYVARGIYASRAAKNRDAAMSDFNSALALDPSSVSALEHRIGLWDLESQRDEADADLSTLMGLVGPETPKGVQVRADYFNRRRMFAEEAAELRKVLNFDPDDIDALWSLGASYDNAGIFDDAEVVFRQILSRDTNDVRALLSIAVSVSQQGRSAEAVALFAEARRKGGEFASEWMAESIHEDLLPDYAAVMRDWESSGVGETSIE